MGLTVRDFPGYIYNGSLAADLTGDWIGFGSSNQAAFSVGWTGTFTGTIYIEGACGGLPMLPLSANNQPARTHILSKVVVTAGAQPDPDSPNAWLAEILPSSVKAIRLRYARSSGTGTLSSDVYTKTYGG